MLSDDYEFKHMKVESEMKTVNKSQSNELYTN